MTHENPLTLCLSLSLSLILKLKENITLLVPLSLLPYILRFNGSFCYLLCLLPCSGPLSSLSRCLCVIRKPLCLNGQRLIIPTNADDLECLTTWSSDLAVNIFTARSQRCLLGLAHHSNFQRKSL